MNAPRLLIATFAMTVVLAGLAFAAATPPRAQAHSHPCHRAHTCPSDHATYRWLGRIGVVRARWLCVKRSSPKYNSTFRRRVVYARLVYWCKR
jgi:hypothetical protein